MKSIYKFKGKEFSLIEDNLALWDNSAKLLGKYSKIKNQYTLDAELDLKPIEKYEARTLELQTAIDSIKNSTDKNAKIQVKNLKKKLKVLQDAFINDKEVQLLYESQQMIEGMVLGRLMIDKEFLKPILKKILVGDYDALDFTATEIEPLIKGVIRDFFQFIITNKPA